MQFLVAQAVNVSYQVPDSGVHVGWDLSYTWLSYF